MHIVKKLTIWNALTILGVQFLVTGSIYLFVRELLLTSFEKQLGAETATVCEVLRISGGDIYDIFHLGQPGLGLVLFCSGAQPCEYIPVEQYPHRPVFPFPVRIQVFIVDIDLHPGIHPGKVLGTDHVHGHPGMDDLLPDLF